MNLLIDIGNTQVKLALASDGEIHPLQSGYIGECESINMLIKANPGINNCIVVKSGAFPKGWEEELNNFFPGYIELKHTTPLPIEIVYETKESLGMDRIASAVGASYIFPGKNILVIDTGTAITVDFINDEKKYLGGNIIPGMAIRFKALHEYTNRLPLVKAKNEFPLLGNSTETAIRAGVLNGIIFEIEGYIDELKNKYPQLTVVMTGGDAEFFAKHIKSNIFVDLNLIFAGLNRIIEYNADQGQNFSH
jgi:type III pantothenate kinase